MRVPLFQQTEFAWVGESERGARQLQGRSTHICSHPRRRSRAAKCQSVGEERLRGTNRIGEGRVEDLERLAFTQRFLVFVCAYCETRNVNSKEDQGHERMYRGISEARRLSLQSSCSWPCYTSKARRANAKHVSLLHTDLLGRDPIHFSFLRR